MEASFSLELDFGTTRNLLCLFDLQTPIKNGELINVLGTVKQCGPKVLDPIFRQGEHGSVYDAY